MRFDLAVDQYVGVMQTEGRINSAHTEAAYRAKLNAHAKDVGNRDPSKTGREDVRRTLGRWRHPNSRNQAHSILQGFYDFAVQEQWRRDNPARAVRTVKKRPPETYRLTRDEVVRLLDASMRARRDRWVAHLGVLGGLRSQELRGLQRRHFLRAGWVWVSSDIAKGRKERWVPVLPELEAVVAEILERIEARDHFVLPGRRNTNPAGAPRMIEKPSVAQSPATLYRQVIRLGERADIAARITPHSLRHAYGDHVAKHAGLRVAQALMGHASVETTAGTYTDRVSLDELRAGVAGFAYRLPGTTAAVYGDRQRQEAARRVFEASRIRPVGVMPDVALHPETLSVVESTADEAITVPVPEPRSESDHALLERCASLVDWAITEHRRKRGDAVAL